MDTELFNYEKHYALAQEWWLAHGWPEAPTPPILPKNGVVVTVAGRPICLGFLYLSDSEIGWVEYVVSDPESDKVKRGEALDLLIDSLKKIAVAFGKPVLFTSGKNPSLLERFRRKGFIMGDTGMTQLVWRNL